MVYDLVVLDPNEDDMKKCSTKLLDGVLALLGKFFPEFSFSLAAILLTIVYIKFRCPNGFPTNCHGRLD